MSDKEPFIPNQENFEPLTKEQESLRDRRKRLTMQARLDEEKERDHKNLLNEWEENRDHEFEQEPRKEEDAPKVEPIRSSSKKKDKWLDYAKTITEFTGLWIAAALMVIYRILLIPTKIKANDFFDALCIIPSGIVTVQNIKNYIAGERSFDMKTLFDSKKREERRLPLAERRELRPAPNSRLYLEDNPGFVFGKYGLKYIGKQQTLDGHIICIGTPGSGKSSAVAIPTLHMWTGAVFAIDIKGELLKNAPHRYGRCVVDPSDNDSYGYDPFEMLRLVPHDEFTHALNDILYSVIPENSNIEEPFWDNAARRYLAGAYTWAYYNCMSFVAINKEIYEKDMDMFMDKIMSSSCTEAMKHIRHIREAADKTKTSIMQNVLNAIELFATDPAIQRMLTRKKTIKPELLLQGQQIFLEIPEARLKNWKAFTSMMINQFLHAMTSFPENGKVQTLVLLDEFPQLGKARAVIDGMATLRSKGCTVCLLMQSYSQLDKVYGQTERKIITDNAAYKLILSVMDPATAREISDMVGQHYQTDVTVHTGGLFGGQQPSSGRSKRLTHIIRPEALQNLGDEALLLSPYGFCRVKKAYYFKEGFKNA